MKFFGCLLAVLGSLSAFAADTIDDVRVRSLSASTTNHYPVAISMAFSMTADNAMKVGYTITTNGVAQTLADATVSFTESGSGRNLWRGDGNTNIGSTYLVRNFPSGGWSGVPVINTNLEAGGTTDGRFWEIDVPIDLLGDYAVTNVLPKVFITNAGGDSTGSGQPTRNNKQYDVNVFYLSSDKTVTNKTVEVRSDKLGAALVNTVSGPFETTINSGFIRVRMDNSSYPGNGAFGGITGIDFAGVLTVVEGGSQGGGTSGEGGGEEPDPGTGGEEPDPETPSPGGDDPVLTVGTNIVVQPLTKAMWNQGRNYNLMCPVTDDTSCPGGRMWAGCTAIATAIVMKYYEWPREGETFYQTINDEKSWENDYTSTSLRARFYRPYRWDKMQDVYGNVTSSEASLAVGELISDIGAVMHMNYGTSGSSTLRDNVLDVLEHNFHFDLSEMYHVENSNFTPEVEKRIQDQLKEGHPIVSAGAAGASGTGHTYVCDGFAQVLNANGTTNNLYHFNFGWGGGSNGWYPLTAVFTSAKPGEAAVERPVQDMFLGVYPKKAPQIHSAADVTGPDVTLDWSLSTCWANKVTGYRLERQDRVTVPVNEDMTSAWSVRSSGWGWEVSSGVPVATSGYSYFGSYWPTQGISANTTNGLAVSSGTSITVKYLAKKFGNGVTLSLIKSDADGAETDDQNNDLPTLANLPGGSSTTAFEEKTVVVSGATLADAFGLEPAYFALRFKESGTDTTYYNSTEVFRLVSFVATGEGEGWETKATQTVPVSSNSYTWNGQPTGDHKYVLTALYPNKEASSSVVKTVRATEPVQPTVTFGSLAGQVLTFNVANTSNYSIKFETQSNIMRGTETKNGSTVTYTFVNDVATMGTHWIALTVTDATTGASGRCVYITNPPEDHPLCPYTERSIAAAAARGRKEGKVVWLLATGDPDSSKFINMSDFIATNEIVNLVKDGYIFTELIGSVPDQYPVIESYWRSQPVTLGNTRAGFTPLTKGYAILIDPRQETEPIPCTPNAYGTALNSQYDVIYPTVATITVPKLISFLKQDFGLNLEPTEEPSEIVVTPGYADVIPTADVGIVRVLAVVGSVTNDVTGAFAFTPVTGGLRMALDPTGAVTLAGETILVTPVLTESTETIKPFVVEDGKVSVGIKTIPGLKYTLLRGTEIGAIATGVKSVQAEGVRLKMEDTNRPSGKAFYRVRVEQP